MSNIYQITLGVHATAGMIGLLLFWWPVIAKKGSDSHKKIGNWFGMAMYVAGASSLVLVFMLLTDPIAAKFGDQVLDEARRSAIIANSHRTASFLMVLGFLLIANIRVGTAVLNNKQDRTPLRRPSYLIPVVLLGGSALYLFSLALIHQQVLFYVFSILGLGNAFGMLR